MIEIFDFLPPVLKALHALLKQGIDNMYMGIDMGSIIKTQLILCSLCLFNNVHLCHVPYPAVRGPGLSELVILCCPLCGDSQVSQQGF